MKKAFPDIVGVTHRYLEVSGTRLHIAIAGKGKPLLLLHGWPQHWCVWRKLIPLLSDKYQLIMPDLPGLGWSDMPENNNFQKENLAKIMIELLDKLNLKKVGLIGHDWGGWIGFLCCLRAPKRFSKYLALGIVHPFQRIDLRLLEMWRMNYQIQIGIPFFGEFFLKHASFMVGRAMKRYSANPNTWTKEELDNFLQVIKQPSAAHASSLMYRTFRMKEALPVFLGKYINQKLRVPTKLLVGDKDPVIRPSFIKGFEPYADDMKVVYIKNCGHFIPEEKPELVAKKIKLLFNS